ncbi:MAG: DUF1569 domain-containing protein [Myxococcales bacterium]|nr:DUF1569 domain-containing protein [Myxococcales bacterium]
MSQSPSQHNVDEAIARLREIAEAPDIQTTGTWSLHQIMEHCRQSVEYSLDGFPKLRPALLRRTIGGWIGRRFLRRERLGHKTSAAIPGAPEVSRDGDGRRSVSGLIAALERFAAAEPAAVKPHFIFGDLSKDEYERLHVLHVFEHLTEVCA